MRSINFVFVTAHNQYAVQAFKTHALGYLLKPVDQDDLIQVVERFSSMMESEIQQKKIWQFIRDFSGKIRLNTTTGFIMLHPSEILYCEADLNYTKIILTEGKPVLVSINLAAVEAKLPLTGFQCISPPFSSTQSTCIQFTAGIEPVRCGGKISRLCCRERGYGQEAIKK